MKQEERVMVFYEVVNTIGMEVLESYCERISDLCNEILSEIRSIDLDRRQLTIAITKLIKMKMGCRIHRTEYNMVVGMPLPKKTANSWFANMPGI